MILLKYTSKTLGEEESHFIELLEQRCDDHGCARPCSIWETKGWLYDGESGAVKDEDFNQEEADKKYRLITAKYYQDLWNNYVKKDLNDSREISAGWNEKSLKGELRRLQKEVDCCLSEKTVCPKMMPNNSVAIFFEDKPTEKDIELMKERTYKFAEVRRSVKKYDKNFQLTILGFRLIKETKKIEECDI